jgi:hypothetical protein
MPKSSRRGDAAAFACTLLFALATFLALCLGGVSPVRAQPFPACPNSPGAICTMTINIFNDDPNHYVYAVLTTGKGTPDNWMQAWFSVTQAVVDAGTAPYPRRKNYRLYINPNIGIPPNSGVSLTIPLYTKLAANIDPNPQPPCVADQNNTDTCNDTFIDWWNGGTVLLYTVPGTRAAPPQYRPPSISDALAKNGARPEQ